MDLWRFNIRGYDLSEFDPIRHADPIRKILGMTYNPVAGSLALSVRFAINAS